MRRSRLEQVLEVGVDDVDACDARQGAESVHPELGLTLAGEAEAFCLGLGCGDRGLVSMLLFILVFIGMLIWAMRLKRPYLDHMGDLPLDSGEASNESGDPNHA